MSNTENKQPHEEKPIQKQAQELLKKFDGYLESSPLRGLFKEMDAFFNRNILQNLPVNIYETETDVVIRVEVPGVSKEQLFIDINGPYVTIEIKNIHIEEEVDEVNSFYKKEISTGKTARTITLPHPIDENISTATYRNGILEIRGKKRPYGVKTLVIED